MQTVHNLFEQRIKIEAFCENKKKLTYQRGFAHTNEVVLVSVHIF